MANNTSQHILNTAATLLGFCLFVITSFNVTNKAQSSLLDDFTAAIAFLLIFSCLFSFLSIRNKNEKKEEKLETIADYFFLISLIGILIIIVLLFSNIIK